MKNGRHISEFYGVGAALALAGGFFDSYTYICRGGVFANAQTGNIILLGLNIKNHNFFKCLYYLMPILSFVAGVLVVEFFKARFHEHPKIHWHRIILEIEILIVAAVGFIPKGSANAFANILISFTCAMQVEAFRKVNGNPYATTMCTGNLRSGAENLFQYIRTGNRGKLKNSIQYFGVIIFFICGAVIGALITEMFDVKAVFAAIIGLLAALFILKSDDEK